MNTLCKFMLCALLLMWALQSCVDKDYDWDKLDTEGIISIPPIPLGKIDTIFLHGLPQGEKPWGIPIPNGSIVRSDTIRGLFNESVIKKFFYDGGETVEILSKIDMNIDIKGVTIDIYMSIIDNNRKRIEEVVIPKQSLTTKINQELNIKIAPQYMKYMQAATDLQLTIVLRSDNATIWIGEDDYIYLRETIIKTGGFYYEL
ncbi:hypothetical protein JGH11_10295 [Dysgonomonas sp. Marseille-P4677]|uniref:hypothetical protein n=1 Tax=Dysgonomonas sp. Marseille-P4677 TaxID=2364790 RepID=UPI0019129705|nr:hypothetical protein [Dysgonomonas sp. Marseille-P4677]MBK5721260.1 hypothetical protein [Dysgonomonas sp. Marseille-P4677]